MKKTGIFIVAIILLYGIVFADTEINSPDKIIPVRVLFEDGYRYDGQKVTVAGEVIGDIMGNGEQYWINIKDEDFFIGIVINASQKEIIRYAGRYGTKGDIVKVSGIYRLNCTAHFGERDIHSEQIEIIEGGYEIPEDIQNKKVIISILLGVITLFLLLNSQRKNPRRDICGQPK